MKSEKGDYIRHKVRDIDGNKEYWKKFNSSFKKFEDYGYEWSDWENQYNYAIAHDYIYS